ncbi:SWIM zinc finger family protein [Halalkalibacter lacteus]|uniref:SWIM zinc finger family protein n=1 Tax=Halalkalibacter lacteus TaxID=3090663 RepID=UPI002FCC23B6
MKLVNFEEYMDDVILIRGKDYFDHGHIEQIKVINKNTYLIEVAGTQDYNVTVTIDETTGVIDSSCDCPYDWGDHCKHQVAAFLALRSELKAATDKSMMDESSTTEKETDLETIISKLRKDELIQIILNLSQEHEEIKKKLLFTYAPAQDEISSSKKLIREYINQAKQRGFIEWKDVNHAVLGAEMTLEKARGKMADRNTESAVRLSIAVLSVVVDMIQYCDDSSGIAGGVVEECLEIINEAASAGIDQLNDREQQKIFSTILKEAQSNRYEEWSDWSFSLLRTCIAFAGNVDLRAELANYLNRMLESVTDTSWGAEYDKKNIKLLQLELLEVYDTEEIVQQFINKNIEYTPFREMAIERLMEKGEFLEVVRLCEEGEEKDKEYLGLVHNWKRQRLQAFEALGDIEGQRELALYFLYNNQYSYYKKLKELYEPNKWNEVQKEILETFEKKIYPPPTYLEILKAEKMYDKLLEYCKGHLASIETLYPYLIESYFEEVNELFKTWLETAAEQASNRKEYKHVCKRIQLYKKACGNFHAHKLIIHLQQQYKKRPAFVDELGKL